MPSNALPSVSKCGDQVSVVRILLVGEYVVHGGSSTGFLEDTKDAAPRAMYLDVGLL